ncbi:enoyl-CoA hydratase/isomerase family protein [Rhodothermus profundi]|uniref:Methylglutaconyl-CoA hydratase n=1 Tax=Rhodothermus profundi TaxID=633813 RepID=A0A1M6SEN6_9BACT|nr:enoyl-CoA hydratase-related protein [Rhodothermus profundi]SHK43244.1 methylglutaconyl-CoA hydratase [Rhodothermus profundi]
MELVHVQIEGPVATLTLNRPEKRNALSGALVTALRQKLTAVADHAEVRVVVLTGAGKVFSAGADLAELARLQTATTEENLADSERLAALFRQLAYYPKPVIARLNGHAIAGGCGLAVACDFAIAAAGSKLGFTEVRIGFVPAIVATFVLRRVGETVARDLLLRGRLIEAEEAVRLGLIHQVVPGEALDATVQALARELATETSPSAVAMTRRLLADLPGLSLDAALAYATRVNALARGTADCKAGIRAFLEKQDPPWRKPGD